MFMPKSVFDLCAGHGDRAIAAMSRDFVKTTYEGCEPNTASFIGIGHTIKLFAADKNIQVFHTPFEKHVFAKNQTYDLIFTSPRDLLR